MSTDPAAVYRDLIAAIRDALDIPLPADPDAQQTFEVLQRSRVRAVLSVAEAVLGDRSMCTGCVEAATEVLRDRIQQLPVTYRPYGPERPEGGNLKLPPMQPQVASASTSREAVLSQVPERQRKNVEEHMRFTNVHPEDVIESAIHRETTRMVRVDQDGLRVESVQEPGDGEHFRIEVYDTATGGLIATANGLPTARVQQTATDLFAEVWNGRNTEAECDECYVQPDGTHADGTTCPCSVRAPKDGCRCKSSPAEWLGPAYVRAEIADEEAADVR